MLCHPLLWPHWLIIFLISKLRDETFASRTGAANGNHPNNAKREFSRRDKEDDEKGKAKVLLRDAAYYLERVLVLKVTISQLLNASGMKAIDEIAQRFILSGWYLPILNDRRLRPFLASIVVFWQAKLSHHCAKPPLFELDVMVRSGTDQGDPPVHEIHLSRDGDSKFGVEPVPINSTLGISIPRPLENLHQIPEDTRPIQPSVTKNTCASEVQPSAAGASSGTYTSPEPTHKDTMVSTDTPLICLDKADVSSPASVRNGTEIDTGSLVNPVPPHESDQVLRRTVQTYKDEEEASDHCQEDDADYMSDVIVELELRLSNMETEEARRKLVREFLEGEIAAEIQKIGGFTEYMAYLWILSGVSLDSPADGDRNTEALHIVLTDSDDGEFDDICEDILLDPFNEDVPIDDAPIDPMSIEPTTPEPSVSQLTTIEPTTSGPARAESPLMIDVTTMTIHELFEQVLDRERNTVRRADYAATWLRSETGMRHLANRELYPLIHELLDMIQDAAEEMESDELKHYIL
ncbi:hypothetical protein LTS18_009802 [Coniosporium uncinatum]|uniref:Uncharacterized protein n=1 Tax=Coniosporium uncinatum TaxID=93489 RepID=A0ACC3DA10_9PEZI|nr:hypothetical protein LTS18_009802 [Coniosporium uncinatum]